MLLRNHWPPKDWSCILPGELQVCCGCAGECPLQEETHCSSLCFLAYSCLRELPITSKAVTPGPGAHYCNERALQTLTRMGTWRSCDKAALLLDQHPTHWILKSQLEYSEVFNMVQVPRTGTCRGQKKKKKARVLKSIVVMLLLPRKTSLSRFPYRGNVADFSSLSG